MPDAVGFMGRARAGTVLYRNPVCLKRQALRDMAPLGAGQNSRRRHAPEALASVAGGSLFGCAASAASRQTGKPVAAFDRVIR